MLMKDIRMLTTAALTPLDVAASAPTALPSAFVASAIPTRPTSVENTMPSPSPFSTKPRVDGASSSSGSYSKNELVA